MKLSIVSLFVLMIVTPWDVSACEWCGSHEAPHQLAASVQIADTNEPGDRLILEGIVFQQDGSTPAADVLLYIYHTNAEGIYPKRGGERGNARRHGYLRGWLRTDEQGRYAVATIRPAPYPKGKQAAHIHMTVKPADRAEYWIDSVLFADDPFVTAEQRTSDGVIELQRDQDGTWTGRRDIVLRPAQK